MTIENISLSISTKVWGRAGIDLATNCATGPGSAALDFGILIYELSPQQWQVINVLNSSAVQFESRSGLTFCPALIVTHCLTLRWYS